MSDAFLAKKHQNLQKKPPIPKPRKSKQTVKKPRSPDFSETSTNYDSKSEQKSYRDKIKERFKSVKENAGKSAIKNEKLPRLKGETKRVINLNKSIDAIKRENVEIENDIKIRGHISNDLEITRYHKYAFFCMENGNDAEECSDGTKETIEKSQERLVDEQFVEYQRPENLQFFLELGQSEVLWNPKKSVANFDDKLEGATPRDLAEEGLYVYEKPNVKKSELELLEKRLLNDDK